MLQRSGSPRRPPVWLAAVVFFSVAALAGGCGPSRPRSATNPGSTTPETLQSLAAAPEDRTVGGHRQVRTTIKMSDGVRLAVTYWKPDPMPPGGRVPIVLTSNPYRQDDDEFPYNYGFYPYFAERGIAIAAVDVRGTGGSEGLAPEREYSDAELADLVQVVDRLAKLPWSNGNIGMMGISWSGFNAIMTAMRHPPALKALLVAHASNDLYGNDIHYIDGVLHLDMYSLTMEVGNVVPRSPGYRLDDAWLRDRFNRKPWLFEYLERQRDGDWWQAGRSLRSDWSALQVPVYAIGALLDGYRDFAIELLDHSTAPVYAEIGPWNHAYPHDGTPTPVYEWRREAVRWFGHWLAEDPAVPFDGKVLTVFQRGAVPPNPDLDHTPGQFQLAPVPLANPTIELRPQVNGALEGIGPDPGNHTDPGVNKLVYRPGAGVPVGNWWGETTGDMSPADRYSLTYDTAALDEQVLLQGTARARLRVASSAPVADWFVRLEDVWPDGQVSLVTGGSINGTQRVSRTNPAPLVPGQFVDLTVPLRFSTYTFQPGHRIRLAVTNAQFPMGWPTPYSMTTQLRVGDPSTVLQLPVTKPAPEVTMPQPIAEYAPAPGVKSLSYVPHTAPRVIRDGRVTVVREVAFTASQQRTHRYSSGDRIDRWVDNRNPARAGFRGFEYERFEFPNGRKLTISTVVSVRSDASVFNVRITRRVDPGNGDPILTRTWRESIPRDGQ